MTLQKRTQGRQLLTVTARACRLLVQVESLTAKLEELRGSKTSEILYLSILTAAQEIRRRRKILQRDVYRLRYPESAA